MFKNKSSKAVKAASKQQPPVFKQHYFNNCHRTYSCIHCRAHLANHDELISKLFQGNHGRAYLFNKVVNIGCKQAVQRELLTGLHAVADIYCDNCETTLGWKYQQAFVPSQKYKEGKYIIELVHMLKENDWDLTSYNARQLLVENSTSSNVFAAHNTSRFRGIESRRVSDFLGGFNEFGTFNLEDKSNGALRMVSLEYELGRGVTNANDAAQRDGHQESSVDILRQPKQNPPQPLSSPSVTFDISLVDSENNEQELRNEERHSQEEVTGGGGNPEIGVMGSSTKGLQHLAQYKNQPVDAKALPVSPGHSLSSSRSQSHFSSSANSIIDEQVTDEEVVVDDLAQSSNRQHDNFKVTNNENLPGKCSDKSNSGNKLIESSRFDLLLSSVGSSTSAM